MNRLSTVISTLSMKSCNNW